MNEFFKRLRDDPVSFALLAAIFALIFIGGWAAVWFFFPQSSGSGTPSSVATGTATNPPMVLSGVTVVAASPAAKDGTASDSPTDAAAPLPPFTENDFGYGIQVQGSIGDPRQTVQSVKKLGMNWIKQQVRWEHIEPNQGELYWEVIDGIINDAHDADLYVMLSVVTAPAWSRTNSGGNTHGPPDNYQEYGRFLGQIVERYRGKIHAIEVWNEQNLDREWLSPGGIMAADYVRLLQVARQAIDTQDPSIIVISGALSPTGGWVESDGRVTAIDDFVYFQQMLDAGLLNYAECVGAHHNGINFPPDKDWNQGYNDTTAVFRGPFDNPHHSWSFKSTLWGYHDMMNGQRKLCVTEFGWATSEGLGGTPPGFEFAEDNSLQEQADWVVQAFQLQREWGITWIAYLWNMDYGNKGTGPTDPNVPYSLVDLNGVPRPAYNALERMEKP